MTALPKRKSADEIKTLKTRLLKLLYKKSFQQNPDPIFRLSSGRMSPYYINAKKTTLDPEGAYLIGKIIFRLIRGLQADGIGGLTLGADPIAGAVALTSFIEKKPIPAFIIRKEPKGHGTQAWLEGSLPSGARVVVLEDVVTTAASALKAIEKLKEAGHTVIKVIALVDRQEGGEQNLAEAGYTLDALFNLDDLKTLSAS
ncbi:MAG TPA: orotate phosphoribosyltransferase [Nitrospiria bacterium]|jgi:orotate phosphoribosyltransferase|nr:orotate phosphoribosyltransferase [Nitrospiria bacterium]